MKYSLIEASDPGWNTAMSAVPHDFYQTTEYHRFESENDEGRPYLFICSKDDMIFAWPYLLRPVSVPGVGEVSTCNEVRSCYGYGSPVFSNCENNKAFLTCAFEKLKEIWRSQRAVCAFARMHPVLESHRALHCIESTDAWSEVSGDMPALSFRGHTVSVNLSRPEDARVADYFASTRSHIRRNQRAGWITELDGSFIHLRSFVEFYNATMLRNQADRYYFFDFAYFDRLRRVLTSAIHLFVTMDDGTPTCAALISDYRTRMQALFIVTNPAYAKASPAKNLVHDVCRWGQDNGCIDFHLGGGRRGQQDSLFEFKSGFSKLYRDFYTCALVLDRDAYSKLVALREKVAPIDPASPFFPAWRTRLPQMRPIEAL
jgi:hypothetical protein